LSANTHMGFAGGQEDKVLLAFRNFGDQ
jgi:hypothetical protein